MELIADMTEKEIKKEIAEFSEMVFSSYYEIIAPLKNKTWTVEEFFEKIYPSIKIDIEEEGMYFHGIIKQAKALFHTDSTLEVYRHCSEELNELLQEYHNITIISDFKEIFSLLEIKENKILFPEKWFSPGIYKQITEFLKTFNCERCKVKKQTGFINKGEFTNEQILQIGRDLQGVSLSTKFDFFPTPKELVQKVQQLGEIKADSVILEPSAGIGGLVAGLPKENIQCVELNPVLSSILRNKGFAVHNGPFESFESSGKFDRILMNPPFSKRLDAKHIRIAFDKYLADGGILVAIHSAGINTAQDKGSKYFQELYRKYGEDQIKIPAGAFKDSGKGTNIETIITKLRK